MRQSRRFLKRLVFSLLVSLLLSSASLYADETYLISEEELTRLMDILKESELELQKASESLTQLRQEAGTNLSRRLWTGIGIGTLVGILIGGGLVTAIALAM